MNKILTILYAFLAMVILLAFLVPESFVGRGIDNLFSLWGLFDSETVLYWVFLPFFIVLGIFIYPRSYKAILLKLLPFALLYLLIMGKVWYASYFDRCGPDGGCGWMTLYAIFVASITVAYGLMLLFSAYIARRVTGTINQQNHV